MLSMEPFPLSSESESDDARAEIPGRIQQSLRSRMDPTAFAGKDPRDALARLPNLQVKELEWTTIAGEAVYLVTLAGGETRIVPLDGEPVRELDHDALIDFVRKVAGPDGLADVRVLHQYDAYYLDRRRARPLPVVLAQIADSQRTRLYIDPKTARVVGGHRDSDWVTRWAYHGLHSFDFPWLYNYRPAWDIVVITFMLGGTALCVTSLVLAWRVLGRKLRPAEAGHDGNL
jgi:hypothetical protein